MPNVKVTCNVSKAQIDKLCNEAIEILYRYLLTALTKLGEECVARARDRSPEVSWIDHTGNLRSSIGYSVYSRGVTYMQSAFDVVLNGGTGQAKGKQMVQELAQEYSNVFALVVLAAMDYAEYVEAMQSKDVLESTRLWAESVVDERLNRAVQEAMKKINTLLS